LKISRPITASSFAHRLATVVAIAMNSFRTFGPMGPPEKNVENWLSTICDMRRAPRSVSGPPSRSIGPGGG
jgi:hypothetical protein